MLNNKEANERAEKHEVEGTEHIRYWGRGRWNLDPRWTMRALIPRGKRLKLILRRTIFQRPEDQGVP